MNPTRHAIGLGLRRGWTEFVLSLRSPQDQGFYLFMGLATLAYLWFNRDTEVEGTDLLLPTVALPSILGALLAFGVIIGPAYALAMEREDGTLLRHKAVPHGMQGYVTGQLLLHSLGLVPLLLVILVPGFLLFDGLMSDGLRLAHLRLGARARTARHPAARHDPRAPSSRASRRWARGGCCRSWSSPRSPGSSSRSRRCGAGSRWSPRCSRPTGSGSACVRRSSPRPRRPLEVGDSWRTGMTVLVLSAWAVFGLLVTPRVLRRMARRQSGSQVQEAKEAALQWVK